jgi:CspA family cold shock protein
MGMYREPIAPAYTGTVKWFDRNKGFGFIVPDNGGNDHFVHVSALQRAGYEHLMEGDVVSYDLIVGRRDGKQMAANVHIISEAR